MFVKIVKNFQCDILPHRERKNVLDGRIEQFGQAVCAQVMYFFQAQ
jgi:hypothetical protein